MQKATFGAGCFWYTEEALRKLPGVLSTQVGYMGGTLKNPTYQDVHTGATGHAQVVQIEYDPFSITYEELLEAFWTIHDPTHLNHQGDFIGTQYRSIIFCHSIDQKEKALQSKHELEESGTYKDPIVTEIRPAERFWRAEERHQRFLAKRALYLKTFHDKTQPKEKT